MQFDVEGYKNLINQLQNDHYQCTKYRDTSPDKKHYILRHDVDMELRYALEMAEVEKELGVNATYFILVSSNFYNIYAKENRILLKRVIECGHCIGLHFDELNYEKSGIEAMKKHIQEESTILSNVIDKKVQVVSMHRPSKETLESDLKIENMINTYAYKYFKEYKYISDSRRCWREDPIQVIQSGMYDRLQILTHPIWYMSGKDSIRGAVEEMLKQKDINNYEAMRNNFRNLEQEIDREEFLAKYR